MNYSSFSDEFTKIALAKWQKIPGAGKAILERLGRGTGYFPSTARVRSTLARGKPGSLDKPEALPSLLGAWVRSIHPNSYVLI